jgi:hypothetical protein
VDWLENILQPSKRPFLTFGYVPIRIAALHSSISHGCNVSGVCKLYGRREFFPNGRCDSFSAFDHDVALTAYFASIGSQHVSTIIDYAVICSERYTSELCATVEIHSHTHQFPSFWIIVSTCVLTLIHALIILAVTPPHAVGLANGVAQSIVSLARCFGPVLGGYVGQSIVLRFNVLINSLALGS